MKSSELLNEAVAGDITVGFELECIVPIDFEGLMHDDINSLIAANNYQVGEDSSVQSDGTENEDDIGIEIDIGSVPGKFGQQRRIVASPSDFAHVAKFIADMYEAGMYTNHTCGFHAHFGLGELRSADSLRNFWFACYFIKEGMFNRYSHFTNDSKEIEYNRTIPTIDTDGQYQYQERAGVPQFEDQEYASFPMYFEAVQEFENYMGQLSSKEAKIEYAMQVASSKYGTAGFEKYNLMNVHEQGTLEWRGLRLGNERDGNNFRRDQKHIMDYLKFVYKFTTELARSLDRLMTYKVGGVTLQEVQRAYQQTSQTRKSVSGALIAQFRDLFNSFGIPKTVVKNGVTALARNIQVKLSSTKQSNFDAEKIAQHMSHFASLSLPIWQQLECMSCKLDPNIITGVKPKFELELKDGNFSGARFDFRNVKNWQKLLAWHGFNFVDCVFESCDFFWDAPTKYGTFNGPYGFDQCTFIDCHWGFPVGSKPDPMWLKFINEEDIALDEWGTGLSNNVMPESITEANSEESLPSTRIGSWESWTRKKQDGSTYTGRPDDPGLYYGEQRIHKLITDNGERKDVTTTPEIWNGKEWTKEVPPKLQQDSNYNTNQWLSGSEDLIEPDDSGNIEVAPLPGDDEQEAPEVTDEPENNSDWDDDDPFGGQDADDLIHDFENDEEEDNTPEPEIEPLDVNPPTHPSVDLPEPKVTAPQAPKIDDIPKPKSEPLVPPVKFDPITPDELEPPPIPVPSAPRPSVTTPSNLKPSTGSGVPQKPGLGKYDGGPGVPGGKIAGPGTGTGPGKSTGPGKDTLQTDINDVIKKLETLPVGITKGSDSAITGDEWNKGLAKMRASKAKKLANMK